MKIFLFIIFLILFFIGIYNLLFDNSKIVGYISFLISIIIFILSYFFPYESKRKQNNDITEISTENTTNTSTIDDSDDFKNDITSSDETTQINSTDNNKFIDNITVITSNSFSGELYYEDQEDYYEFIPDISGVYRFDFDSNDYNANYDFYIYTSNNEKIASSEFSSKGETIDLIAGQKYIIAIEQYTGYPEYSVSIGIPNDIQEISANMIEGSLSYSDQVDTYTYTAPLTGRYRFDFSTNDVQSNYIFYIYSSRNEKLNYSYDYSNGLTITLNGGETYTIYIHQNKGTLSYKIDIYVPNETKIISENSFTGSIYYTDQIDCYKYTAPITGTYRFDFDSDNVENNYKFYLYSSDNTELASSSFSSGGKTVDLISGEIYTIEIEQKNGTENYEITIGVPNEIRNINENCIIDTISYIDQKNIYTYTAPISGEYTFTFNSNDDKSDYKFFIVSSFNEDIASSYYSSNSKTVSLNQDETYTITVKQYSGFPSYQIDINIE